MNTDLLEEIVTVLKHNKYNFVSLEADIGNELIKRLANKFFLDLNQKWLWDTENVNFVEEIIENDKSESIQQQLVFFHDEIYVVITDDEFFPWPVLKLSKNILVTVLNEVQFFEFFIFDDEMNCILFDNHHSELIIFKSLNIEN
jgi:hypothetical protein